MKIYKNKQAGFTLIELLVTGIIVAIAAGGIIALLLSTARANERMRNVSLATQAVERKVEDLRNSDFYSINDNPPNDDWTSELPADLPGDSTTKSASLDVTQVNDSLKQIDIIITYDQSGQVRTFEYSTFIGFPGITQ